MSSKTITATLLAFIVLVAAGWWVYTTRRQVPEPPGDERSAVLPRGAPSDFFGRQAIGEPAGAAERPQISNVQIVDLDRDGLVDVLACDVVRSRVVWLRQFPKGAFTEIPLGTTIPAPAHVEAIDFDKDGDLDLVVASLGVLNPSNIASDP